MFKKKKIILILGMVLVFTLFLSLANAEDWGYGSDGTYYGNITNTEDWGYGSDDDSSSVSVITYYGNLTNLFEMQDVNIPTPTDGHFLTFDSASGDWISSASVETLWNANYSLFTPTTDLVATLGNWTLDKSSYASLAILNNGTYTSVGDVTWDLIWTQIYNKTEVETILSNGTFILDTTLNNGTYSFDWNSTGLILNWSDELDLSSYVSLSILNNGTYANGIDYWSANYSDYVITKALATNGTFLEEETLWNANYSLFTPTTGLVAILGNWSLDKPSYASLAVLNNGTYTISTETLWNANYSAVELGRLLATNNTYYLASNPDSYISSYTETDPFWSANYTSYTATVDLVTALGNWTLDKPDYASLAVLNNGSYTNYDWNSTGLIINWSVDTSTFATLSEILAFNYYNSTDFSISDYYLQSNPLGYYNSTTLPASSEPLWNANFSAFENVELLATNGTFYLASNPSLYIPWSTASNGTLALTSALADYTLSTDLVASLGNWSADKPSYASLAVLNNGSYLNVIDFWSANYSEYENIRDLATNGTFYLDSNPDLFIDWATASNGTLLTSFTELDPHWSANFSDFEDVQGLVTNGTFLESYTETDPFWSANYSAVELGRLLATNNTYYLASNPDLFIDWATASNGTLLTSYTETDPLWSANFSSYTATADLVTALGNWTLDKSSYASLAVLNNGSYLNGIDYWSANYSEYKNIRDLATNGTFYLASNPDLFIDWSTAANGTLLTEESDPVWESDKADYYLLSNPNGYYNSSSNIGNWTLDKPSYASLAILNNGSYIQDLSSYSTLAILNNGTYANYDWNSTGLILNWSEEVDLSSYTSLVVLNNGTYANGIDYWSANYSAFENIEDLATNGTFYLASNPDGFISSYAETDPLWTGNQSSYTLLSVLNNGTYTSVGDVTWDLIYAQIYNETEVDAINTSVNNYISDVNTSNNNYILYVNGTMAAYVNSQDAGKVSWTDLWGQVYNESEIDTLLEAKVDWTTLWEQVYNETEIGLINDSNNNYIVYTNSTMKDYVDTRGFLVSGDIAGKVSWTDLWDQVYNETEIDTTFGSYATLAYLTSAHYNKTEIVTINTSMKNYGDSTFATITNLALKVTWTDLWTQVYNETEVDNLLLTKISWTDIWSQVYNETEVDAINTSVNNYISDVNTSVTNTFGSYYTITESDLINTSNNNYILYVNGTIAAYVDSQDDLKVSWTALWGQVYNESEIDTLLEAKVDWTNLWLQVYNETEIDAINASVNNYIVYTNGTMKAYVDTRGFLTTESDPLAYNGTLAYNTTFDNYMTTTDINLMNASNNNYITYTNGTMKSYVNSEDIRVNTTIANYVNTQDALKVSWADIWGQVYNESEVDTLLNAKASLSYLTTAHYNKTETDNLLNLKVTWTDLWAQVYNESETDSLLDAKASLSFLDSNYYNITNADLENASNNNYILYTNSTMKDYVDKVAGGGDVTWTELWNQVYNETEVNAINTSMNNHVLEVNSTAAAYTDSQDTLFNNSMADFTNKKFFSNIANFTGTLTNAKYCVYTTGTGIVCNSESGAITEVDPYWTGNQSLYTSLAVLNNGTYANVGDEFSWTTLWTQVYNETEVDAINTSMKNYVDSVAGGISWAEAVNGTLYLSSNPFSFYNSTDFDIADYSTKAEINITPKNWTYLQNYPAACPAGSAITQLDDTITCTDGWVDIDGDTMTGNLEVNANFTVNTDDLFINSNTGNIGIGTDEPLSILHIREQDLGVNDSMYSQSPHGYLTIEDEDARLGLFSENEGGHGSTVSLAEVNAGVYQDQWSMGRLSSGSDSNFEINYGTNVLYSSNPNILTLQTDGNMGIGTTVPNATLSIREGAIGFDFNAVNIADQPNSGIPWMRISGGSSDGIALNPGSDTGAIGLATDNAGRVILAYGGGKVGIAKNAPTAKLDITQDTLTGNTLWAYRNKNSTDTDSPMVFIEQDNADDDKYALQVQQDAPQIGVLIDQNGNEKGLWISSAATTSTKYGFQVNVDKGARAGAFQQSGNQTGLNVQKFATGAGNALDVYNAGTGYGIFIDQNGNGIGLNIDSESTTAYPINVDGKGTGGISIYASNNISAEDYLYHSPFPEDSYTSDQALNDLIKVKGINGKIDHDSLPINAVSDLEKPIIETKMIKQEKEKDVCSDVIDSKTNETEEVCYKETYFEDEETKTQIGTENEPQTSVGMMIGNIVLSIKELFNWNTEQDNRIKMLEDELCAKENTYSWCLGATK